MKTIVVPLIGDPVQNLYQLGLREKEAFFKIENRVSKLLSTNVILRYGQDIVTRARFLFRKKEDSFFEQCIKAYSDGLGIDHTRYLSFIALFELAAHYGQIYPELKGLLPGCTSVFSKTPEGEYTHSRLLDFPLVGIFDQSPRLYYWRPDEGESLLTYSCEGLAPLFFQGIHGSGMSFALHHKPGKSYHREGQSIFHIAFETLMRSKNGSDFRKEIKTRVSISKWSFHLLERTGQVLAIDVDGPTQNMETYQLGDTSPLIFTNIPLIKETSGFESYLRFSEDRQTWVKEKLSKKTKLHELDLLTDVNDQNPKKWIHPAATLSTVGAYSVNLSRGFVDLKEGNSAMTSSDRLLRLSLEKETLEVLKEKGPETSFERAWKKMARAQSAFDQGDFETSYHELQMARADLTHPVWRAIVDFYQYVWDFKFIGNNRELALIYKKLKALEVPPSLKDQWLLLIMRFEKRLDLIPTVTFMDVSDPYKGLFQQEKLAPKPVFATWMKLLYPRLEILDVFSPHSK